MKRPIRVCVIGTGFFSRFHYDAWSRIDDVDVVALCAETQEQASDAAARLGVARSYHDLDRMLSTEKPDLLDIVTPPPTHRRFIECAVSHGVAAICQKPFCNDLVEAETLVDRIESTGGLVVVHENFRFQPWYRQIRELLDGNVLGDVYQATFRLRPGDGQGPSAYLDRQPYFQTMERFLVHETAIHIIDVFRYLFGDATQLYASLSRLNPAIAGEDAGFIVMEHDSGVRTLFDGNRLVDHPADNHRLTMGEMLVEGAAAVARLDGWGRIWIRRHGDVTETPVDYHWNDTGFGGDCVYGLQRHVIDHIITQSPVSNTARDYLTNLRLEEVVYRSSAEGRRIDL